MKTSAIAYLVGGNSLWRRAAGPSWGGRLKRHLRERAALRKLRALDDHMLADIGLSRGSVGIRVVRDGLRD